MTDRDRKTPAKSTITQASGDQSPRLSALPISALWVPALGVALPVPQRAGEIVIGSAPECDVVINHSQVSRRHAVAEHRSGGCLEIRDTRSKNGIAHNGTRRARFEVQEGRQFSLGSVRVLTMNDPMRVAHRRLETRLGFADSLAEFAVMAAAGDMACVVLSGGRGLEPMVVARAYAMASPRCEAPFEVFDTPTSARDVEERTSAAKRGVVVVDSEVIEGMPGTDQSRLVSHLTSPAANTMLIYVAPDEAQASARLGRDRLVYMSKLRIPTLRERIRSQELPLLIDRAFEALGVGFSHRDIEPSARTRRANVGARANLARLEAHDWPENHEELRLCAIYIKGKLTDASERQIADEMGRSRGGMRSLASRWALSFEES